MNEIRLRKKFGRISSLLITAAVLISLLQYVPVISSQRGLNQNYLTPLLWGILCCVIWIFVPRLHPVGKVNKQDSVMLDAIICATILLGCRIGAGFLLDGFGKSPYDLSINGIRTNLFMTGPELIAKELVRSYCVGTYCRKGNNITLFLIALLFSLSYLNLKSAFAVGSSEELAAYLARYFGPELCRNVMLSWLSLYGGAGAAIIYAGILTGFMQFFPVLPSLKWITEGVIGISVPILEAYVISNRYAKSRQYQWSPRESAAGIAGWIITLVISIAFIWFIIGVFPVYPSVIATGSMKPLIHEGDVILIKRAVKEEDIFQLKEGDIIQFIRDDILITHRILQVVRDDDGNISFRTKGDNNSVEDARLVLPNEVRGTLTGILPKIGIPTLWIKSRGQNEPQGVEF